jgi:hypothetical protein
MHPIVRFLRIRFNFPFIFRRMTVTVESSQEPLTAPEITLDGFARSRSRLRRADAGCPAHAGFLTRCGAVRIPFAKLRKAEGDHSVAQLISLLAL